MGKRRNRNRKPKAVYTSAKPLTTTHIDSIIAHSIEILKLRLAKNAAKQYLALLARSKDNFLPYLNNGNECTELIDIRIIEHAKACSLLLKKHLGTQSALYEIKDHFWLSSTDLKSGYVLLSNVENTSLHAMTLCDVTNTILEPLKKGQVIEFDANNPDKRLSETISLLKNETVLTSILSTRASMIENYKPSPPVCYSSSCLDRKSIKPIL